MPFPIEPFKALAFDRPMDKAVKYLESKGIIPSWSWQDVQGAAAHKAFTVAKLAQLDLLSDVHKMLTEAQKSGMTLPEFQKQLKPKLKAAGWWGKVTQVNPNTGQPEEVLAGTPWRIATIYRTNMQSAYMAGRQKQMTETSGILPYWQYIAVGDARTRPAHASLNGAIFKANDPFWENNYPPNGYNCRCRTRALLESQAKRFEAQGRGRMATALDKKFEADKGFGSNPASFEPEIDENKYPKKLAEQYHKALKKAPPKPEVPEVKAPVVYEPQDWSYKGTGIQDFAKDKLGVDLSFDASTKRGNTKFIGIGNAVNRSMVKVFNEGVPLPSKVVIGKLDLEEIYGDDAYKIAGVPGAYHVERDTMYINPFSDHWNDVKQSQTNSFESGWFSTDDVDHIVTHELGHAAHANNALKDSKTPNDRLRDWQPMSSKNLPPVPMYDDGPDKGQAERHEERKQKQAEAFASVSRYGTVNRAEFVAEAFAKMMTGGKLTPDALELYKRLKGVIPKGYKP